MFITVCLCYYNAKSESSTKEKLWDRFILQDMGRHFGMLKIKLTDKLNLVARENLSGLMVIRAFGTEDFEGGNKNRRNFVLTT